MMEHATLPNESGHELAVGRSRFSGEQNLVSTPRSAVKRAVRKKAASREATPARPLRKRRIVSRNRTTWFAAIAGAPTWLRVSSSGGIGDAASVSVNAMGRRPGRGRRRSRNSSNTISDEWPGSKGLGLFALLFAQDSEI